MKKLTACLILAICLFGCQKEMPENSEAVLNEELNANMASANAALNPVFVFQSNYNVGKRIIPGIFVMDTDGGNMFMVYSKYTKTTISVPDYPAWNSAGTKICFTLNQTDLYTLNINVLDTIITGTGAKKIGDGVAGGGSYKQGKWKPGANKVASVWKKTGDPDKIHLIQVSDATKTVLFTAESTDWVIEDDIAFNPDGQKLLFSQRQVSTGNVFLNVLELNTGQIIQSVDLSLYKSVKELDWGKMNGSSLVAITTIPKCDTSVIGRNGIHQLFTLNLGSATPSLNLIKNDVGNIALSPDDLQITINSNLARLGANGCALSQYTNLGGLLNLQTGTRQYFNVNGNRIDWKR